jgi:glutamate racemase
MKIGIFDSGLGGLLISKEIIKKLPQYDYLYLGDTKRVPYGNRSEKEIYRFTEQAIDFLFRKDCALVIVACNTVSARALRKIQRGYLKKEYPNRRVLGVIIPAVEDLVKAKRVGILATAASVKSKAFVKELHKINPKAKVFQEPAPVLVPLIEKGSKKLVNQAFNYYLEHLLKNNIDTLILGCTHYLLLKDQAKKKAGSKVHLVAQDLLVPEKLKKYLKRHPELEKTLERKRKRDFYLTKKQPYYDQIAKKWFRSKVKFHLVNY